MIIVITITASTWPRAPAPRSPNGQSSFIIRRVTPQRALERWIRLLRIGLRRAHYSGGAISPITISPAVYGGSGVITANIGRPPKRANSTERGRMAAHSSESSPANKLEKDRVSACVCHLHSCARGPQICATHFYGRRALSALTPRRGAPTAPRQAKRSHPIVQ